MRRSLQRTTRFGLRSRAYRFRLERLEPRSMMAADIVAAADIVSDETSVTDQLDELPVDPWLVSDPPRGNFQPYEIVDPMPPMPVVDPVVIDDSCLMVDGSSLAVYEPIDVRVQFVSPDSQPGWAAYYYTIDADGVVRGVSVVASYDEPTIADFVAKHADDPAVMISDYGDGWYIDGFPLELAPPVPETGVFYGGFCGDSLTTPDESGSVDVVGDWSWDDPREVAYCGWSWDDGTDGGGDWTTSWDDSGVLYGDDWSWNDWTGGDFTVMPLFYARGAGVGESFGGEFVAFSSAADASLAGDVQRRDVAVVEPVAVSGRSAVFADMSMMAAAATGSHSASADAVPFGGGRRRR